MHMRETGKARIQLKAMAMAAAAVITAVLLFGLMTIVSHAEEGTVTASSVKIRASADVNSGMIGGAMAGEKLQITGEVTGADNYTWYQVTGEFENGATTGYVRSDCVSKTGGAGTTTPTAPTVTTPTTPASSPATDVSAVQPVSAKVTGEQVRVRSNASTSGSIVSMVKKDVVLTVTGTAQDSEGKTWYQVSFSDANGQVTGFIREDFVSLEGELVPPVTDPVEPETPVVTDPVEPEPTPAPVQKDYDTQFYDEEGGWYLMDYTQGKRYLITDLFDTAQKNKTLYEEGQAKIKSMRIIMIILVVAVILLALTATLLFFKIRDMMDAAYFEEVEKETVRSRQGQRSGGKASMPTVGAGGNRSSAAKPAGQRPSGAQSQQRPAGGGQQRPAGSGSQSKPVSGSQQRPAGQKPRPAGNGQQRPAGSSQQRPQSRTSQQERPGSREQQNASRQAKNFMADDDEFDFEYLNWDGEEDN